MGIIGKKIKELRIAKGYTQEQLGKLLSVSTQAVSKWERGGTPDIELLPQIADVLETSIDSLFGREPKSVEEAIATTLRNTKNEEVFDRAFRLCWAINAGLSHEKTVLYDYPTDKNIKDPEHKYFSKLVLDQGIVDIRLSEDFRTFFLMPEPEGGILDKIESLEKLQELFALFADLKVLKILTYMYTRLNTPIAASLISKNTGIDEAEVEEYMTILSENNLAHKSTVATADGPVSFYIYCQENSVIPLLCLADETHKKVQIDYWVEFERTKPLFYQVN